MTWAADLSIAVAAAGIAVGLLVLLSTGRLQAALPVTLELFMAAGLLRLSADATWSALATAAVIVLLRKLIVAGVRARARVTPWGGDPVVAAPSPGRAPRGGSRAG